MMTSKPDPDAMTEAELRDEVRRLRGELQAERSGVSRRSLLRGGLGVAGVAALLYASDPVAAAPTGTFPASSEPALLKIRADRVRWVGRTSDPSSPNDGATWYRGDL